MNEFGAMNFNDIFQGDDGVFDEETIQLPVKKDFEYKFTPENIFMGQQGLFEKAQALNEDLKVHEAALALEADVQENPDNIDSWKLLGVLHQENDEDEKAIYCFRKAQGIDPNDLEIMLQLGISCCNEIQPEEAFRQLENWL